MRGLLEKAWLESRATIATNGLVLACVVALLLSIIPAFEEGLGGLLQSMPLFRRTLSAMLGLDLSAGIRPGMLLSVVWTHPVLLAIVWGFALTQAARLPATEIESGTVDVLLGWPVSRRAAYAAVGVVAAVGLFLLAVASLVGFWLATPFMPGEARPDVGRVALVLLNQLAMNLTVFAAAQLLGSLCERRAQALTAGLSFVLASFLLQFLARFWDVARPFGGLSVLHYYKPAPILLRGAIPMGDVPILLIAGCVFWGVGLMLWERRSVRTV